MKKRILVVEDEVIIADNLCKILGELGYEVLEPALSYREALASIREKIIHLAILDIQLGGKKTGIDIANVIRKEQPMMPFVYLTSFSDQRTIEMAKATMPYGYLVKPFEAANVLATLEIALNNHEKFVLSSNHVESTDEIPEFTHMEKIVLRKIADGSNTEDIASQLEISKSTVKNHRHNICKKLGLPGVSNSLTNWVLRNKKALFS